MIYPAGGEVFSIETNMFVSLPMVKKGHTIKDVIFRDIRIEHPVDIGWDIVLKQKGSNDNPAGDIVNLTFENIQFLHSQPLGINLLCNPQAKVRNLTLRNVSYQNKPITKRGDLKILDKQKALTGVTIEADGK